MTLAPASKPAGERKLTVRIGERRTTMRLSPVETAALRQICAAENLSLHEFCTRAVANDATGARNQTGKVRDAVVRYLLERWAEPAAAVPPLSLWARRRDRRQGPRVGP